MPPKDAAQESKLYLQDLDLVAQADEAWSGLGGTRAVSVGRTLPIITSRRASPIVDDETMNFLWDAATQLDQRVCINERTGTVEKGAWRDNVFVEQLWRRLRQELRA